MANRIKKCENTICWIICRESQFWFFSSAVEWVPFTWKHILWLNRLNKLIYCTFSNSPKWIFNLDSFWCEYETLQCLNMACCFYYFLRLGSLQNFNIIRVSSERCILQWIWIYSSMIVWGSHLTWIYHIPANFDSITLCGVHSFISIITKTCVCVQCMYILL